MANLEKYGITDQVVTELYLPHIEQIAQVTFDGIKLVVEGVTEFEFTNSELMATRTMLYNTMRTPDVPVARADVFIGRGKVPSSRSVLGAANEIEHIFIPTGVNPIKTTLRDGANKNIRAQIESVTYQTRAVPLVEQRVKARISAGDTVLQSMPDQAQLNKQWVNMMQRNQSELLDVNFDRMSQFDVALFRIMHKNLGTEFSVGQLKDLYNELNNAPPINDEKFLDVLTRWASIYTTYPALKRRIVMRPFMRNGKRDAAFSWQAPGYRR